MLFSVPSATAQSASAAKVSVQNAVAHETVREQGAPRAPEFPLRVEVRAIRADGMVSDSGESNKELDIDSQVRDLTSQLERLHYTHFHMVNQQAVVIPPRKRRKLELVDGHHIVLRPIAVDGDNICLWLKWKDKAGTELLDTRLRFVAGESMLTGTDHMPDAGLILAIRVEPVRE